MISEKMKEKMKARKAKPRAAQLAEMLVVRVLFGSQSTCVRQNKEVKINEK